MTEEELITEYKQKQLEFYAIADVVGTYFMQLVHECLNNGDIAGAKMLIVRCPDNVTCAFMMDAINVKEGKYKRSKGLTNLQ